MKVLRWTWAMVPVLSFGTLSWLAFGFLAARRHSRDLTAAAVGYLALLTLMTVVHPSFILPLWGLSSLHAFRIASGKDGDRRATKAHALPGAMPPPVYPAWSAGPPPLPRTTPPPVHPAWSPAPAMPPLTGQPQPPDALLGEIANSARRFNSAPVDRRIAPEIWGGLHTIVLDSWTLLTTAQRKGITGDQLIAVELMYSDYVPSSVRAVTALSPEQLVTAEDADRVNRSAREIIDAICNELTAMMRSVTSGDLSKLDQQRIFLQSRFGESGTIRL
jgi:hypothetical protein